MSKGEDPRQETTRELDCSNAGRGVWLVKVPKYIAKKWLKGEISGNFEICIKIMIEIQFFWKSFQVNLWFYNEWDELIVKN